ncbi:gamma-glutamyl-gamma-aminobutyrate hydrolase family protein [Pikeienuella piscinae]|uniref:gamma-glutamyl-gamma-aminobutyrate hydrolase n=1 Tax=Pikeienuella piscinae TaxID=2748098 RepID=A0A7L5BTZ4_9RHOB|nr:gamma-glutamyl-gamma-aminobutyrate hydrolase family protein [Pikeienuella piscinae]QIE54363.1 gamma-glutamyl-gamma-aminobutyrate hydrolase family protein [Pikeienuella piscinae]
MTRPIIGVSGGYHLINDAYRVQATGERNLSAVAHAAGGLPLIIPGMPDSVSPAEILDSIDGLFLTGGRPNVHPSRYGHEPSAAHEPYDEGRDDIVLPLIRGAVEIGMPVFGVCRGIQEIAVALGGTLHPEVRDLPGKMNHRMPPGEKDMAVIFRKRHKVRLTPGGWFARTLGTEEIVTNSLHGQAVVDPGPNLEVEGVSEDGVIEAIRVPGARGLAIGVQWHAEYEAEADPVSAMLFSKFGEAAKTWRHSRAA